MAELKKGKTVPLEEVVTSLYLRSILDRRDFCGTIERLVAEP